MTDIRRAHAQLIQDPGFQFRFPRGYGVGGEPWAGGSLLDGAGGLFWVVAAVIVAALAWLAVLWLRGSRPARDVPAAAAVPPPGPLPRAALADADALAGAGLYGAAVHALLLRGLGAIQDAHPEAVAPAHTSREIAALDTLPLALRVAFSGIAVHTERAVFAQAPLGVEEWDACRALYAGLAAPAAA